MKNNYCFVPIKIWINDYKNPIRNSLFHITLITEKDKKDFFWLTNIKVTEDWVSFVYWFNKFWQECTEYINTNYSPYELPIILCKTNFFIKARDEKVLDRLIFCFRLYKKWNLNFIVWMFKSNPWTKYILPTLVKKEIEYEISKKDIRYILKLYSKIDYYFDDKKFFIELFNTILDNNNSINNSYFNCVSLLEWLLVKWKSEVSFQFSLNSSYLLNKLWFNVSLSNMKNIYNIRSRIAHWDTIKIKIEDLLIVLDYTREILKYYFENDFKVDISNEILSKLKI